jgi:peptide/nickel transport system substrate-binding protein
MRTDGGPIVRFALSALAAVVLALTPALPAAARPADLHPSSPSTVVVALSAMPAGVNPLTTSDQYSADIEALLYDPLYYETPEATYAPDLALSWQVRDGGLTYLYTLSPKARWSDGRPVSPADVVATLEAYASARDTGHSRAAFADLLSVTAMGAHGVKVQLREPDPAWPGVVAGLPILPGGSALPPAAAKGQPRALTGATDGPYLLKHWDAQAGDISLAANPAYFRGAPHVARIEVHVMPAADDALSGLRHGTVQVAILPPSWAASLKRAPGLTSHVVDTMGLALIAFDVQAAPLQQAAVRRALTLAVNRSAIIREAVGGSGAVPVGPWPAALPSSPAQPTAYDPALARALLTAAGWRVGAGGVRMRAGIRLSLTLRYPTHSPALDRAVAMVAANWRAIGAEVRLVAEPWSTLAADASAGHFQALAMGAAFGGGSSLTGLLGGPSQYPPSGQDIARYDDSLANALLVADAEAANEATPPAPVLAALATVLAKNPPYLPLWSDTGLVVTSATLSGFVANPAGPDLYQPQTWILP